MDTINRINPLLEILRAAPGRVNKIFLQKEGGRRPAGEIAALAKAGRVPYLFVPKQALDKMSAYHQGVVALITPKEFAPFDQIHERVAAELKAGAGRPFLLFLDEIEDPQNLGAILRSAEVAAVDAVILPERRSAGLTDAVYEVSAGALEHLRIARVPNLHQAMERFKELGVWMIGAEGGGDGHYWDFDYKQPVGLVLGSEGKGLRPLVRRTCDRVLSIPVRGRVNSLNVASAASVFMFEVVRQRVTL